ncbi:MAG: EamA family transporter [Rhodospirillaceae bacterium]|jgi:uncharacterized membrane protein|nr:EamA family transporter [Rhodospirillaceae bacterium]MBT6119816.1 EamA family transporter [Rhodospirillaceae bacterium]
MNPGLWGAVCAVNLGCADFTARFTSRGVGPANVLLAVMSIGAVLLSGWIWLTEPVLVWDLSRLWLVVLSGASTAIMTLLLYQALARGPVSIVAPIVASHPVLVVLFWVATGHRPEALQWAAMGATMLGALLVARSAGGFVQSGGYTREHLRKTISIAGASALAYAVLVVSGQAAVPIYGELQTLWLGRWIGIGTVLLIFVAKRKTPGIPLRWWPLIGLQSLLDATGYLALFAGSQGEGSEIAAVAASGFGAITTILARIFLREAMGVVQWVGVALVFLGVAVLSVGA